MKLTLVIILSVNVLAGACFSQETKNKHEGVDSNAEKKSEHMHSDPNKSNMHMNKTPFEDLTRAFEDESREAWQKPDEVIKKLGTINGKTVGDIGSGTGYFSFRLAEQNANVVAIDVDERFQAFIEQKKKENDVGNLTTRLVGYDNPGLADNEFDVLIIVDTYHHFNDKIEYMSYCRKGLKDNGLLMIVDFKKESTSHGPPVDHRISVEIVKQDLKKSGFKKIEVDASSLSEQYIITARK